MKKRNGFTLVEILIGVVVGVISIAALFFTYETFNKAFKTVEAKSTMNSNARDALSLMAREIRNTGRVDTNWLGDDSPLSSYQYIEKYSSKSGYKSGTDYLRVLYDDSAQARVEVGYGLKKYSNSSEYYLARTFKIKQCTAPNSCSYVINNTDQIFINNVEDLQVVLKDHNGNEVSPVNSTTQAAKDNQANVKSIEIYLVLRSGNKIYSSSKDWQVKNSGNTYTKKDQYHRDSFFVSIYPRNIVKN